jgi:hypothetical protein
LAQVCLDHPQHPALKVSNEIEGRATKERDRAAAIRAKGVVPGAALGQLGDAAIEAQRQPRRRYAVVPAEGDHLDKGMLMRTLWRGLAIEENNLSQMVCGLRRALGNDSQGSRFIQTVPRRGFRFIAAVRVLAAAAA